MVGVVCGRFAHYGTAGRSTAETAPGAVPRSCRYDSADRLVEAQVPTGEGAEGQFHPVTPARLVDSRNACGTPEAPRVW